VDKRRRRRRRREKTKGKEQQQKNHHNTFVTPFNSSHLASAIPIVVFSITPSPYSSPISQ
jgi:hypothetical protein